MRGSWKAQAGLHLRAGLARVLRFWPGRFAPFGARRLVPVAVPVAVAGAVAGQPR